MAGRGMNGKLSRGGGWLVAVASALVVAAVGAVLADGDAAGVAFSGVGEARVAKWTITALPGTDDVRFCVECRGFSATPVDGGFSLQIPGQASSARAGTPAVPRVVKLLPGFKGRRAVLTLQGMDSTNISDVAVVAAEGFKLDNPDSATRKRVPHRDADPEIYGQDRFWPVDLGRVEEAWIGTQKVVRVECFPVQYNPVTRTVRFYRRIEGALRFESLSEAR